MIYTLSFETKELSILDKSVELFRTYLNSKGFNTTSKMDVIYE
jgi:hypothetical protein